MFPYLKNINEFLEDCEQAAYGIELDKSTGAYECCELDEGGKQPWTGCSKGKNDCKQCRKVPALVAWLIQNVDQANWGKDKKYGIRTVAFSEVGAWCRSLCGAMHELLEPLKEMNLTVGLEYYLENRFGAEESSKNHNRVDVMLGGYGLKDGVLEKRLLVIELKQYSDVSWSYDGRRVTYFYNNTQQTEESPNYQVKYYCDNITRSMQDTGDFLAVFPCVFMHNLSASGIRNGSVNRNGISYGKEGPVFDHRVLFEGCAVPSFISGSDESDRYSVFRDYIRELFDYSKDDKSSLDVFKTLKKGYYVLSQEDLADMLICDDLDKYRKILRPDQYFVMYGYGEKNYDWDNYIINHVNYLYFFRNEKNRTFWEDKIQRRGVIDVVEGGPGSGKSILAMMLLRYCLERKLSVGYVYTGSAQVNKIMGVLAGALKDKLKGRLTAEQEQTVVLQDLVNNIPKYKLEEFGIFKGGSGRTGLSVMPLNKAGDPENADLDVYIIDDAHNAKEHYSGSDPGKSNLEIIESLEKAGKLVIIFYDRHMIIDDPAEVNPEEVWKRTHDYRSFIEKIIDDKKDRELFDTRNAFRLRSMFRCNMNEGYLTWIENELGIGEPVDEKSMNLFDYDVRIVDEKQVKELAAEITADSDGDKEKEMLVLSESADTEMLADLLGQNVTLYSDKNGRMTPTDRSGSINIGKAVKVRGVETTRVLVIIDKRIKKKEDEKEADTYLKNCYRVLLTRGLRECYIFVADEELRNRMEESLRKVNRLK